MTAVSVNRTLKSIPGGDAIRSCPTTAGDKSHYEMKSVIMPLRSTNVNNSKNNNNNNSSASGSATTTTTVRGNGGGSGGGGGGGTMVQTTTNRQPINASGHSYSSDSDVVPNTTTTPSATAMRRLYFKSAKLSKTTQNSITTVHQQQAQHVPKVNNTLFFIFNFQFSILFAKFIDNPPKSIANITQ